MRMSASGLASTIARAIDQILRLAPSISPPIEPVVSTTKATSTSGLAEAHETPKGRNAASSAIRRLFRTMACTHHRRHPARNIPALRDHRGPELRHRIGSLGVYFGEHLGGSPTWSLRRKRVM